jgi:hypothetical protein
MIAAEQPQISPVWEETPSHLYNSVSVILSVQEVAHKSG